MTDTTLGRAREPWESEIPCIASTSFAGLGFRRWTPMRSKSAIILACVLSSSLANADTTVQILERSAGGREETTHRLYITADYVRVDSGTESYLLYDTIEDRFYVIDPDRKTYSELTKRGSGTTEEQIEDVAQQIREVLLAQLQEALPEHVDQMAEGLNMNSLEATPVDYVETSEEELVLAQRCRRVDVFLAGVKVRELWMASREELEIPREDYAALVAMQDGAVRLQRGILDLGDPSVGEFPLRIVHFDAAGRPGIEKEVISVFFGALDRELFGIPDDYQSRE